MLKNIQTVLIVTLWSYPVLAETGLTHSFFGVKGGYNNNSALKGTVLGLYTGSQLSPFWSWDIGYQYHDGLKADTTSVEVNTWLLESALRYDWRLKDNLSLYGRLGAAYWNMEKITQYSLTKSDAAGVSPIGELGVNYHINPNVQVSTGYQYIKSVGQSNTGKYDSHGLLLSLTYQFGNALQHQVVEPNSERALDPVIKEVPVKEVVTVKTPPTIQTFSPQITYGLFGFDSVELNQQLLVQLTEISSVLISYPQAQAKIVGHTDSIGSVLYNQNLSERRAKAVVDKLIDFGVTPTQLEYRGNGNFQSLADNTTAEGRAKNRRVEIIIPSFQFQQ